MQHYQQMPAYSAIPKSLDYLWIAYDREGDQFVVSARHSKLSYEGELALKGGQYIGAGASLEAATAVANIASGCRDGGYPYGIRVSEDAVREQNVRDAAERVAEEGLAEAIATHRMKVREDIENAMGDISPGAYEYFCG